MKKIIKQSSRILSVVSLALIMFISCSDEKALPDTKATTDIKVSNGYLEFRDDEVFENTRNLLKTKDISYLDAWEKQFSDFHSQRSIFEQAIEEELKFAESGEFGAQGQHSQFVSNNSDVLLFDEEGRIKSNLPITEEFISAFVNRNGLVKIGGKLYQYSEKSIKVIVDGDDSKLPLLPELGQSSLEHGVLVYNIEVQEIDLSGNSVGRTEFVGDAGCTGYSQGGTGNQRVIGNVSLACTAVVDLYGNYGYPGQIVTQTKCIVNAVNEIKNVFGWNRKTTNELYFDGTVNINSPYNGGPRYIEFSTSGNSASSLSAQPWVSPWYPQTCGSVGVYITGSLYFEGRGASVCTI